ncbi:Polyphosphate glucokinase [Pseudonocardia sp. Ae168_Ps1]|uniref:polyphosphate--glucose phosphotransferase n=1 Tax=unclassified Pseudonocardia TaxID=2619320 RepID=UPI00094B143D|nr:MULTISPECIES: ROK family protein [unclassified Pseudonocardia]OLL71864.1 Polyphosphate glucokinase [Pseudonocardia sp. Ae150A_Ps1]OLL77832.1 Polyphosphate glucokinase [Pseudonocardia sp. Ae168_Ps1]OLL88044.1 Polyphosphate glucokinase [Pseudonocardia sp. Ae263_Ps1]OLL91930.1 Polyphosphate glucokinase [Pseudonocardia sp. Ae356_Ps1]
MSKKHGLGFGIDIGGSGIKGAPVDLHKGKLADDRVRIPTPQPSTPEAVAETVKQILDEFDWKGPFGCTFPAVVQHGVTRTAANVDPSWIDCDAAAVLRKVTGRDALLVNDADAAGVAEVEFGAAGAKSGVVLLATLGTGIGSTLIADGHLVPNTEFGHLEIDGFDAESRAADSAREREDLDWEQWGERLTRYFTHVENLVWPDLIVVGGGVSKRFDRWSPYVRTRTTIVPATLLNEAGIIGAALLAHG